jgi:hypothetical protein
MFLASGAIGAIVLVAAVRRCFKKEGSDSLWVIKPEELRFDSTPVCVVTEMSTIFLVISCWDG